MRKHSPIVAVKNCGSTIFQAARLRRIKAARQGYQPKIVRKHSLGAVTQYGGFYSSRKSVVADATLIKRRLHQLRPLLFPVYLNLDDIPELETGGTVNQDVAAEFL